MKPSGQHSVGFTAFAHYIMRGRSQAAIVAAVGSLFFLVTLAALSLVTLRRGALEGTWVIAAALVFAVVLYMLLGGNNLLSISVTAAGLVVVYLSAIVLRMTASWPHAIATLIVSSAIISVLMAALTAGVTSEVEQVIAEQAEKIPGLADYINRPALIVSMLVPSGILGLLLGRWLQALAYNPGGFRQDFHQLRLGLLSTVVYGVISALCLTWGKHYLLWAVVVILPLLMVSSAVVHHWAASKNSSVLLWLYYFLLTFPPLMLAAALVGFLDHWVDFRSRLRGDN